MVVSHLSELVPTPDGSDTSDSDAQEPLGYLCEGEC